MTDPPVLRVEFVPDLIEATGCAAVAWTATPLSEGELPPPVQVDAALRSSPRLNGILWHESLHLRIARRLGFGAAASAVHGLLDGISHVFHAELLWWRARGRPAPPWVEVRA
ncbi:MAG TPA: hypothetical protein VFF67_10245 [Thermoplasmata archaeon]|nr:hypothetical protein [Thermoplasmata archaeon]